MKHSEDPPRSHVARTLPWPVRFALVGLLGLALVLIWTTNQMLTQRFIETNRSEADVQLALFSGNLLSELERQQVVPQLLARDPVLINALIKQDFALTTQQLMQYREEIGAAALTLLDASGRIVASTHRQTLIGNRNSAPFFVAARRSNETVFSTLQDDLGRKAFFYSRRIDHELTPIGVVVVEVNLKKFLPRWSRLAEAVVVLDSTGQVILSTERQWIGKTEDQMNRAVIAGDWRANDSASFSLVSPEMYGFGEGLQRQEARVEFQGWRLVSLKSSDGVRGRVNSVLAVEVMVFAILIALMFFILSRQANLRSRRFARESDRLRRLNQRLQAEIAERERAERNLQEAELSLAQSSKLAALGEMSAAVSHELNQPLAAMKTYLAGARLLIQRSRNEEALASFLRIDGLIDRMGSITRQLKAHARKEPGDLRDIDLRDCVSAALEMMAPQISRSQARVNRTLPEDRVRVCADPLRIEQVIVNLVRNAIEATAEVEDGRVDLMLSITDGQANLIVRDNGTGIADLHNLFEPFYTTKAPGEGVGLGLAISSSIIKSMEGRLTARNAPDRGAIFKIALPLSGCSGMFLDDHGATPDTAAE